MRALTAGAIAAGVVGLGALVIIAGKTVPPTSKTSAATAPGQTAASQSLPVAVAPAPSETSTARSVGSDLVAEPDISHELLVREKPREPLSTLGQALPPPEPEITLFYRPVATGSASFDSMGYKLAIAGTEGLDPDETCTTGSIVWPCGTRARTAVRMWLRGRALTCTPPPKNKDVAAVVECSLGKQDVGAWLVSNGWARAAADGPYAAAEEKARKASMGIFGLPPKALPTDQVESTLPSPEPSQDAVTPDPVN